MKNYFILFIYLLSFQTNLFSQTIEYKRPGLSLQFTALEYSGTYHFPTNNRWFNPQIQYDINNEQLDIYRDYLKKIIVVNGKADSLNIIQNAGLMLHYALNLELATWSSLRKANKRQRKDAALKYSEQQSMGGLKKKSIYILTYEDFVQSKQLQKIVENDENKQFDLNSQLEIIKSNEDSYFLKYIDGNIVLVGNNQRSTLYGIFDIISKIERRKSLRGMEQTARSLPKYRLANLWNGIDVNENETFLSQQKIFYNIFSSDLSDSEQFIYEKLAQMLAYYNLNGIVISGNYDVFSNRYDSMLKLFKTKMDEYGVDTYIEVSAPFAENNKDLIDEYFNEHKGLIKGLVISSLNLYGRNGEIIGGASLANSLINKEYTVIWRDEQVIEVAKNRKKITFKNQDVEKLDEKVVKESLNVYPGKYRNTIFSPADVIDQTLIKSYALHWKGLNPYADYKFPDKKTDIAFLIYFYTRESQNSVQIIDERINNVQP
jgi:hypothetical protein